MTRRGRIAGSFGLAPVAVLAGAILAVGCLTALEARARLAGPGEPDLPPILTPHQLTALSGGFGPALADTYWIRAAAMSADELDGPAADRLYRLLDRVTALDPAFEPAYHQGALLLSVAARRPDLSDRLLVKARAAFPDVWAFPFYLGFNAFYHRTDFPEASRYMAEAARLPGAPAFLGALAERFADETRNREVARELVERMLRVTRDPVIHQRLLERLRAMEGAA
jgi:hypothetical protein